MLRAIEQQLGSLSTYRLGVDSYDSTKLGLGTLMCQRNDSGNEGKWAGPFPIAIARPMEYSTPFAVAFPWAMQWSNSASSAIDWFFLAENSAAAATRRIMAGTYNRLTQTLALTGFITITFPTATNHTIRGLRMTYDKHTTGTVAVSGTAVTGTSTVWQTNRACVGNRIGFGSTDPSQITTWYEISAIGSDTSITLTTSAGTISAGTAYVIEDLRAIILTTNATTTNGGLFVVKGLRFENFVSGGTAISAATTVDNIRASYWLADASTVTNITGFGLAIEPISSFTSHICWALDTTTNPVLFKYNIRGALTLTAGKDTTTLAFKTGSGGALTGTASQSNNGRFATVSHGPGSGLGCIYFTTTTRVYRTVATSTITTGSTTFLADNMTEVPPGGTSTVAASSLINSIEYSSMIDRFIIPVNVSTTAFRNYFTQYNSSGAQLDRLWGAETRIINQGTADSSITPHITFTGAAFSAWSEGGICYIATLGTAATTNFLYLCPLSADWEYASTSNQRIILPSIPLSDASSMNSVCVQAVETLGGMTGKNLGLAAEPWRIYYRTSGISDNSGNWTLLDQTNDLSSVGGVSAIQFMLEFRTIGTTCIPSRINSIFLVYNDLNTDSHYQFSIGQSSLTNKRFAWRFSTAFNTSVPALRVRLYDATSGGLLVDDNTTSPTGTFERSTNDGSAYSAWNNTDKGNETTYLRYTPASLADNIKVKAVLTLA